VVSSRKTLLSVLDQQYPNLEYFVQDGGSKDSTVEVLKKYREQTFRLGIGKR